MKTLEESRKNINEIDAEIARLFERRMRECADVAEYKKSMALPVADPKREEELLQKSAGNIEDDTLREYYVNFERGLMEISKNYQQRILGGMKVACCGVPGAFASAAVAKMFPGAGPVYFTDFLKAYKACEAGEVDSVVLPIENSFAGEVSAVTDIMFSGSLYINNVVEVEAVQNLLACKGATKETIKDVVSHPQALAQCSDYIRSHSLRQHSYHNTAAAAKMVAARKEPWLAAIAGEECAELYGLQLIERHINSASLNTTRFAAFSRTLNEEKAKKALGKHFILMFTVKNEAGSLAKTLNIIGAHGFNMTCLRSRPMKGLMWTYYFYIELEGNVHNSEGRSMMLELGTICDRLKLVGSF